MEWITPDWPAPRNVRAAATLRSGGVSQGAYASLNLGAHVGDDPDAVRGNRERLRRALDLPREPLWLNQVHGPVVFDARASAGIASQPPTADASVSFAAGQVCAILTADCLPVLLCDRAGTRIAAAHGGWRGLAGGVIAATVTALESPPADLMAWLGPAIEAEAFEVGPEVREQFLRIHPDNAAAFSENARGRWQADIYELARRELRRLGVDSIHGGGFRCFADRERFFSYRRDGQTGRMGTMIWQT
jgi:polyphenol oxidase